MLYISVYFKNSRDSQHVRDINERSTAGCMFSNISNAFGHRELLRS